MSAARCPGRLRLGLAAIAASTPLSGCAAQAVQSAAYLSEDEVIDLMQHPREWDGRTVTVRVYPYDQGGSGSYPVCFEPCDEAYADRSPFILYAGADRFRGYRGDRPAVITARYASTCFYRYSYACPDLYFGQFTEIASQCAEPAGAHPTAISETCRP